MTNVEIYRTCEDRNEWRRLIKETASADIQHLHMPYTYMYAYIGPTYISKYIRRGLHRGFTLYINTYNVMRMTHDTPAQMAIDEYIAPTATAGWQGRPRMHARTPHTHSTPHARTHAPHAHHTRTHTHTPFETKNHYCSYMVVITSISATCKGTCATTTGD